MQDNSGLREEHEREELASEERERRRPAQAMEAFQEDRREAIVERRLARARLAREVRDRAATIRA